MKFYSAFTCEQESIIESNHMSTDIGPNGIDDSEVSKKWSRLATHRDCKF